MFANQDDPKEAARISYRANNAAELAFILFHEGFRCGYNSALQYPLVNPPNMEAYIKAMYDLVSGEIRDQNPGR